MLSSVPSFNIGNMLYSNNNILIILFFQMFSNCFYMWSLFVCPLSFSPISPQIQKFCDHTFTRRKPVWNSCTDQLVSTVYTFLTTSHYITDQGEIFGVIVVFSFTDVVFVTDFSSQPKWGSDECLERRFVDEKNCYWNNILCENGCSDDMLTLLLTI